MNIILYSNFSKKQNSTRQPAGGVSVSAHLKDGTSVLNPTFQFDAININVDEIYAFGRYYFVDDMTISTDNVCEVHCSVDVLASYKAEIGASSQNVIRAQSAYDEYLTDNLYPASNKTSSNYVDINLSWTKANGFFVWGLIGEQHSAAINRGSVNYFILNASQSKDLADSMQNPTGGLLTSSVPTDFVSSIVYIPITLTGGSLAPIQITNYKLGTEWLFTFYAMNNVANVDMTTGIYSSNAQGAALPDHPQAATKGKYVNFEPYSYYKLFCGPLGEAFIDRHLLNNTSSLRIQYDVDLPTGACRFRITKSTALGDPDISIMELNGMLGAETSVGSVKVGSIGATTAAASSILSTAINLAAQNYAGAAISALSAIGTGIAAASPQVNHKGSNASRCDYYNPVILCEYYELPADDPDKYGRPLCQTKVISTLSGYIKCGNASLPLAAFDAERQMVENLMNSGFYYE